MPTARAICASRAIGSSASARTCIMRSANSAPSPTTYERRPGGLFAAAGGQLPRRDALVVLVDVARADLGEQLVALLHLAHGPAQRPRRLLGLRDHRHGEVRDRKSTRLNSSHIPL